MQRSTRGAATVGVGRSCSPWHPHSSAWAWWRRTDAEVSRACCGLSGCVQLPRKPHGMAGAPRGGRGRAWGELSPLSLRSQIGAGEAAAQGSSVSSTVADEAEERRPVSLTGTVLPESGGAMGWRGGRAPRGGRGRAWGELSRCAFFGSTHGSSPLPVKGRCGGLLRPRDGCASASPLVFSLLFASFGCSYKRGDQCGEPAPRWSLSHILDHIIKESG